MPDTENFKPQLWMVRPDLDGLPPLDLPEGCELATYGPGSDDDWGRIITASFGQEHFFEKTMASDAEFRPERVFFVMHGGEAVATASAWYDPSIMADAGTLHYVGALPGHQGKKLGYWVSLAALHRMVEEGRSRARLQTDDWRLAAIKTYLNLGFGPFLIHENQRARWASVFEKLGLPELAERFAGILTGPVWEKPDGAGGPA